MIRALMTSILLVGTVASAEPLPLVVVLHGYGATPEDIAHLVDGLPVRVRVVAPHGATAVGQGWSWMPLASEAGKERFEAGLRGAADAVAKVIADEERAHPGCGAPIVTGFSQGGFLSYALAVRATPVVGLALPIGGFLPPALVPDKKPKSAPRIVAFHGEDDHRVELGKDRTGQAQLAALGFATTLHTYPGVGHEVSLDEQLALKTAIAVYVRAEGCAR